ncbi:MAG: CooT family nickel-binding protein [Chloroflexota bacterium]
MCEATVYLSAGGEERRLMENVVALRPDGGEVLLADLLGEQKVVKAHVKEIDFVRLRVVLESDAER